MGKIKIIEADYLANMIKLKISKLMLIGLALVLMVGGIAGCDVRQKTLKPMQRLSPAKGDYVLVYNGEVAAEDAPESVARVVEEAGLKVKYISDISQLPRLLPSAKAFIVGGTKDDITPLMKEFKPNVVADLKKYLKNGGRYLGICGGAFLGSTGFEEEDGFVKMLSIIPAESGNLIESIDPTILPVNWYGKTYQMYFQAGPVFYPNKTKEQVRIIARYKDGQIAGLMNSYGKGKVAGIGPHPEAPASWADEADNGEKWKSTKFLAVNLLEDLLSDRPVKSEKQ